MNTEDRRAPGAARIAFDGLVEVGGALGPTFEAQAVNVSEEGIQLRTTYLPELGQEVTCRFEAAPGDSVIGSGEVVWCRSAEKGGEFAIRFSEIDADSVDALKRVCGLGAGAAPTQPGGKVRLYIEGLASPMRAKVRDSRPTAITVGSDLGFLQVGKQLELEDAQSGCKRPASIDRVEVAVDPRSHVPQLIVTLRYADVPADGRSARTDPPGEARASEHLPRFDDPTAGMKGALARQAASIGPAFKRFAQRVKTTAALLAKRGRVDDDAMPRRTTAPPPGGGLHASGRRVVRGEAGVLADPTEETAPPKGKAMRRRATVATAVMAVAVLGAVALKRSHHDATPQSESTDPAGVATSAPVNVAAPAAPPTESALAAAPPPSTALVPTAAGPAEHQGAPSSMAMAEDTPADGSHAIGHKTQTRVTPFGNGAVHHGNVLRLKMDGPVESIEGAQQPTGFVVKIPGRRSLEAAAPLAARDSRIATIKVQNQPSGAELTVAFRDGVPNYQVSARGESLVIALAPAGPLEPTVMAKRDEKGTQSPKHGTRGHDASPER